MFLRIDEWTELHQLEAGHAQELFEVTDRNRIYLREWLPWVDGTRSVSDTERFIEVSLREYERGKGIQYGIFRRGKIAGCIGLHEIDWDHRHAAIGYWLSRDHQGLGIMTECCRMLIGHAFHEWRLHRVEIRAAVANARSRAIPERLGFTAEGVLRQVVRVNGCYLDHVVYGLLKDEWQK
jgi:ribosomal-protein-serine acetyltransferase